jgi:hypothetical protein
MLVTDPIPAAPACTCDNDNHDTYSKDLLANGGSRLKYTHLQHGSYFSIIYI